MIDATKEYSVEMGFPSVDCMGFWLIQPRNSVNLLDSNKSICPYPKEDSVDSTEWVSECIGDFFSSFVRSRNERVV